MKPPSTLSTLSTFLTFLTLLTLLSLSFLLPSCTPKNPPSAVEIRTQNGQPILYVDMDQCRDTIDFDISAIVDSCRMVRLENRPEALIGRVSEMAFTDNRIYLYHQEKFLMAFDYDGKYREQIGNLGKGPYEYQYLNNLAVGGNSSVANAGNSREVSAGDSILILGEPHHIDQYIIYNAAGAGRQMLSRKLNGDHKVMILPGNKILEFGYMDWGYKEGYNKGISLFIQDFTGKTILEKNPLYLAGSYRIGGVTMPICFYQYKDEYRAHFSRDTLFNLDINTGSLNPIAVFTASENGFPYHQLDKDLNTEVNYSLKYSGKVYAEIHAETPDYFLIRQMKQGLYKDGSPEAKAVSYFSIDKKNNTAHPVRLKDTFFGLDLEGTRSPMPFTHWSIIDNKYAVLDFQAIELKAEIANRLKDPQLSPALKDKLKTLDSTISTDDNVVLFIYCLKTR